jgi:thioesterase domain-containing protein
MSFNYLGQANRLFDDYGITSLARESAGSPRSPHQQRAHLLEINAMVIGGRLQVEWTYGRQFHRRETIERLAALFEQAIGELIAARPIETSKDRTSPEQPTRLAHSTARSESPLVPIQPRGSRCPLFLVHPAGGTVFPYYGLAHCLGQDQPFYGLRARGLVEGEAPHTTIEAMAVDYWAAVKSVQPTGPYALGGWSFGGLVAYEMARLAQAQGQEVAFVGLLDTRLVSNADDDQGESAFAALAAMFPEADQASLLELQSWSRDRQVAYFVRQAEAAQLVLPGASTDESERMFDIFEANSRAWLAYRPQPQSFVTHLFQATEQDLRAREAPREGWQRVVANLVVDSVPGNHLTMVRQPNVRILAERLQGCLVEASHATTGNS